MLSCKKASELNSRAMDEKLSFRESMALKIHLLLCRSCKNFVQQLAFLRDAVHHSQAKHHFHLSDETKQRITRALKDKATPQ